MGSIRRLQTQQFRFLQRQFLQDGDLPFTNVLTNECLSKALDSMTVAWKDRVYTPLVTLWVFLGQVLSADHSCRASVARLIALHNFAISCCAQRSLPRMVRSYDATDLLRLI